MADTTLYDEIAQQSANRFRDECFPNLRAFNDDVSYSLSHYSKEMATVTESLSLHQQNELMSWIQCTRSQLLWVDGCLDQGRADWTTALALELIGSAHIASIRYGLSQLTVIYHFCSAPSVGGVRRTPEIVVQDLIFQLVASQPSHFTRESCKEYSLTKNRFQEASKAFDSLWDLFEECLVVAKVDTLLVVIDNLDSLCADARQSSNESDMETFQQLVTKLVNITREDKCESTIKRNGIRIKVICTTRLPDALLCLPKLDFEPPWRILRIATAPYREQPSVRSSRLPRIPIEAAPTNTKIKVDEVLQKGGEAEIQATGTATIPARRIAGINTLGDDEDLDSEFLNNSDYCGDLEDSDEEGEESKRSKKQSVFAGPIGSQRMSMWSGMDDSEDSDEFFTYSYPAKDSLGMELGGEGDSDDSIDGKLRDSDEDD